MATRRTVVDALRDAGFAAWGPRPPQGPHKDAGGVWRAKVDLHKRDPRGIPIEAYDDWDDDRRATP